jgi:hypothetical protein
VKRKFLLIFAAVVVLVIALNLFTRGSYISGKIEKYAIEQARDAVGYELGMDKLVFNFLPMYIELKNPYIKGWDPELPQRKIDAERVRIYINPGSLLNRQFYIRRVQVYRPAIQVVRGKDDKFNIEELIKKLTEEKPKKPGGFKVKVEEVVVFGGAFEFHDKKNGLDAKFPVTDADIRLVEREGLRVGFRLRDAVLKKDGIPELPLAADGDAVWKDGSLRIKTAKFSSGDSVVKVAGKAELKDKGAMDLVVSSKINLGLAARLASLKKELKGMATLSGKIKGAYPKIEGSGKLEMRGVTFAGIGMEDFSSRLDYNNYVLTLEDIESRVMGGRVSGTLRADFAKGFDYKSSWAFKDITNGPYTDNDKMLNFLPWYRVTGKAEVNGSGFGADGLGASGIVDIVKDESRKPLPSTSMELSIIKRSHMDFRIAGRKVFVSQGTVQSAFSRVDFAGSVGFDGTSDLVLKGGSSNVGEIASIIGYNGMTGKLDLTGYVQGNIVEPDIFGKGQFSDVTAGGIPIRSGFGDVKLSGWQLSFKNFAIQQGDADFMLNGSIYFKGPGTFDEPYYDARLTMKDADVRKVVTMCYEDLPINLTAGGEMVFVGNSRKFKGTADLKTGAGDVYGQSMDKGEIVAVIDQDQITFPKVVVVKGRDIVTGKGGIKFNNTFYGKITTPRFDLSGISFFAKSSIPLKGAASLSINGEGSFDHPEISATASTNKLSYNDIDLGGGRVKANISGGRMTLTGALLDEKVNLGGELALKAPYHWRSSLVFDSGRFEPFIKLAYKDLPQDVEVLATGSHTGEGDLDNTKVDSLSVDFRKLSASLMGRRLDNDGDIRLLYRDGRLAVKSFRMKGESATVELSGGSVGLERAELNVKANANLDMLKSWMKESVDYIAGNLSLDIGLAGDLRNPAITGKARITDGGIKFTGFPQRLDRLASDIRFEAGGFNITSLSADFGGGTITAKGGGNLKGFEVASHSIDISAADVKLKYPEGLNSAVDARINFEGVDDKRSISGNVTVKRARYTERIDWKSWMVKIQKKRTEVSGASKGIGKFGDTALDVRVAADETIKIDNNVAKIPVSADLSIRGTIANPVVLGRMEAQTGSVYFRNNEFKLVSGVVDFVDPRKLNPIIDIQAEARVREYQVQLALAGTLDRIKVQLSSDPPLDDEDILSLLAIGRTSEKIKGHEAAVTTGEAASFVTGQLQDAVESRVKKLTGVDRFQIDPYLTSSGTSSGPRLTIGKSLLSDKLYLTYSSNVGTSEDQYIRMEYFVNKNISVVGARDELGHFGADIKFRFEFK